ncbi:transporter [Pelomonas cellulosilytica]|uniref:Transporter n=1 Tax=Pelomonas cellulosilytica TaxID=2906762 RepID=A0ABS8XYF6_9BURK|nr:transporter [Pelomonas sp. P8]MCE4555748.1 transporter [Pelomonas sp. P8]
MFTRHRLRAAPARWGAWLLLCGSPAWAAHPLQTEDTGTQGQGNVEIEKGLSWTRSAGTTVFAFQPQLSYGLTPALDLIVQPSWQRQPGVRGFGDTALDAKWRFFAVPGWSLGLRAGASVSSGDARLGLPRGTLQPHGLLVATVSDGPWTLHANLGLDRNPAASGLRRHVAHASAAVVWAAADGLAWTLDVGTSSDPDPARRAWPATLLTGFIYTLTPHLDADLGYQRSANARPASRQWLLGLTYRFST